MSENTSIEWADHTFNPWEGCQKVGPACDFCYAETRNARFNKTAVNWGPGAPRRRTSKQNWRKPLKWNADAAAFAAKYGRKQRVFCASLADIFDNAVDPQWRRDLFDLIYKTPNLDWLLLTKRIGIVPEIMRKELGTDVLPVNVWLGATIANREEMLRDAPKLAAVLVPTTFWSYEPALGDLGEIPAELMPDWIVAGGENAKRGQARCPNPQWFYSVRDQCAKAGTAFLFKQWGSYNQWGDYVGKKKSGRLLAGQTHDEFPI